MINVRDINGIQIATVNVRRAGLQNWYIRATLMPGVEAQTLEAARANYIIDINDANEIAGVFARATRNPNNTETLFDIIPDGVERLFNNIGGTGNDSISFLFSEVRVTTSVVGTGIYEFNQIEIPEDTYQVEVSGTALTGESFGPVVKPVPRSGIIEIPNIRFGEYIIRKLDANRKSIIGLY